MSFSEEIDAEFCAGLNGALAAQSGRRVISDGPLQSTQEGRSPASFRMDNHRGVLVAQEPYVASSFARQDGADGARNCVLGD